MLEVLRPRSLGSATRSILWGPCPFFKLRNQATNIVLHTAGTHNDAFSCVIEVPTASAMMITVFVGVTSFSVVNGNDAR